MLVFDVATGAMTCEHTRWIDASATDSLHREGTCEVGADGAAVGHFYSRRSPTISRRRTRSPRSTSSRSRRQMSSPSSRPTAPPIPPAERPVRRRGSRTRCLSRGGPTTRVASMDGAAVSRRIRCRSSPPWSAQAMTRLPPESRPERGGREWQHLLVGGRPRRAPDGPSPVRRLVPRVPLDRGRGLHQVRQLEVLRRSGVRGRPRGRAGIAGVHASPRRPSVRRRSRRTMFARCTSRSASECLTSPSPPRPHCASHVAATSARRASVAPASAALRDVHAHVPRRAQGLPSQPVLRLRARHPLVVARVERTRERSACVPGCLIR